MEQSSFSPEQSLKLINEMINRSKRNISNISFFFLIWGWLLFFAGISIFILLEFTAGEHAYVIWPGVALIGGIISWIYGSKLDKQEKSRNLIDKIFEYLWLSFAFTLVVFIVATVSHDIDPNPFVLVLTGLPTFVTGMALKFKPLKIGGILFWVIGIASFFILKEYTLLLFSAAILLGYIVPGYLLRKSEQANV